MIPEGKHRAVAVRWGFGKAKTGTEQVAVVFDFLDLPGQSLPWYGSFTERAMERTIDSLRHCGWTCNRIDRLEGMGSQEVQVVVEHEERNGNLEPRIKWVNAGGIKMATNYAGSDLRSLADRIQAAMGGGQPPVQRERGGERQFYDEVPKQAERQAPRHSGDDIPF